MNESLVERRLAVCSWSLQPEDPEDLVAKLQTVGIRRVQLALDPLRLSPVIWGRVKKLLDENRISIVSGMFGCIGEDYSTLESIRMTGGLVPDATWEQNRKDIEASAVLATELGLKLVTFHAGFIPHEESDATFGKLLERLAETADIFARQQIALALETGQETAPALSVVLQRLGRANVGVNFDPANVILYNNGDPIEALRLLGPWLRQVHIKDAVRTKAPGTWGEEVVVGAGDVRWREFFLMIRQVRFDGDLVIEREAGDRRVADVVAARRVVEQSFS
jgi:L-ribulose-5-phosphate 3-epimerase